MLLLGGVYLLTANLRSSESPGRISVPSAPISITGAPIRGESSAPVAVLVFSDFQCRSCADFATDILPELTRNYLATRRVMLVFRHRPLSVLHPYAMKAAQAAECARQQGKFWQMHDQLFRDQELFSSAYLKTSGTRLGLDRTAFEACMSSVDSEAAVRRDIAEAQRLGVVTTPSFLIGVGETVIAQSGSTSDTRPRQIFERIRVRQTIAGLPSFHSLSAAIDDSVRAAYAPFR